MRKAKLHRKTAETEIRIALTIEGRGKYEVSTGIRFLDHMMELFTRHGGFDLEACTLQAISMWISITPSRMSGSLWARFSTALWETGAAFCGPVTFSCPWMRRSGWQPSISADARRR